MIEVPDHPWFLAVQFHPEFTSRPNRPQPLFREFVKAAFEYMKTDGMHSHVIGSEMTVKLNLLFCGRKYNILVTNDITWKM